MTWSWEKPPAVVLLAGDSEFLRVRELKKAISAADLTGREVLYLKGEDREALSSVLSTSGIFFTGTTLAIVEDPEKVDVDLVLGYQQRSGPSTSVVLYLEGGIKSKSSLGKLAGKLPKEVVADFGVPKSYQQEQAAVDFLLGEAKLHKLKLSSELALEMVRRIGTDYGILAFEVDKTARLLTVLGREGGVTMKEILPVHVRDIMAGFSELGAMPIVEALGVRNLGMLSKALGNMRRTHAGHVSSAVLKACSLLSHNVTTWIHAASLLSQGVGVEEIAVRIKLPPFVVRKNILSVVGRWSEGSLVELLNSLARVERGVRGGHLNSWVELECALFHSVSRS